MSHYFFGVAIGNLASQVELMQGLKYQCDGARFAWLLGFDSYSDVAIALV